MPTIRSPGQILKLWKKGTADYFKANSLKEFPAKENLLNVKLVKSLDHLRKLAGQGGNVDVAAFTEARDGAVDSMSKLRKLLLPSKTKPTVKKFFQTLCRLQIVVEQLEADKLDASEADLSADALDGIDPDAVGEHAEEGETAESEASETGATKPTDAAAFAAHVKALMPLVVKFTQAKQQGSDMLAKLVAQANTQAQATEFAKANDTLGRLEQLLKVMAKSAEHPAAQTADGKPLAEGAPASNVAFTKARLLWDKARKSVQADLQKLEQSILQQCKEEPDAAEIAANSKNLYEMLDTLDTSLIDKLDDALNAADPGKRNALYKQAAEIVADYSEYVETDSLIGEIDDNPFTPVKVHATLTATLKALSSQLK